MLEINKLYNCDCLDGMKEIPDKSVDMILCDLPYGTTACKWDTVIPFKPLWEQYERVIKDNGAIILFGSQPFTSILITSNIHLFKYGFVWDKKNPANFYAAKYQPLKQHENILVFSKSGCSYGSNKLMSYYPVMEKREKILNINLNNNVNRKDVKNKNLKLKPKYQKELTHKYPKTILEFGNNRDKLHPTQKPVDLCEYLIKTYTKEGETVLDNCIGSGTTAIAALNTGRNFIGFELSPEYCDIANKRIEAHTNQISVFELQEV